MSWNNPRPFSSSATPNPFGRTTSMYGNSSAGQQPLQQSQYAANQRSVFQTQQTGASTTQMYNQSSVRQQYGSHSQQQQATDKKPFEFIYHDAANKLNPTLTSIDQSYCNPLVLYQKPADNAPNEKHFSRFANMRCTDIYEKPSNEMLRLADILGQMQNKPSTNYEYEAAIEYCTKGGLDHYAQQNGYKFQSTLLDIYKERQKTQAANERDIPINHKNDTRWAETQKQQHRSMYNNTHQSTYSQGYQQSNTNYQSRFNGSSGVPSFGLTNNNSANPQQTSFSPFSQQQKPFNSFNQSASSLSGQPRFGQTTSFMGNQPQQPSFNNSGQRSMFQPQGQQTQQSSNNPFSAARPVFGQQNYQTQQASSSFMPQTWNPQQQQSNSTAPIFGQNQQTRPMFQTQQTAPMFRPTQPSQQQTYGMQTTRPIFGQTAGQLSTTGFNPMQASTVQSMQNMVLGASGQSAAIFQQAATSAQNNATAAMQQQQAQYGGVQSTFKPVFGQSQTPHQTVPIFGQQQSQTTGQVAQHKFALQPTQSVLQAQQTQFELQSHTQSKDPYGLFKFLAKKQEEQVSPIKEELRMLQQEAAMIAKNPNENAYLRRSYLQGQSQSSALPSTSASSTYSAALQSEPAPIQIPLGVSGVDDEEARFIEKQNRKYGGDFKAFNARGSLGGAGDKKPFYDFAKPVIKPMNLFSNQRLDKPDLRQEKATKPVTIKDFDQSQFSLPNQASLHEGEQYYFDMSLPAHSFHHEDSQVHLREQMMGQFAQKGTDPDVIVITVILKHHAVPREQVDLTIQLHRQRDVSDIALTVAKWLNNEVQVPYKNFRLLFRNQIVSQSLSLEEAGIVEDAKVFIQLIEPEFVQQALLKQSFVRQDQRDLMAGDVIRDNESCQDDQAVLSAEDINEDIAKCQSQENQPIRKVLDFTYPTQPKDGYQTTPVYSSLLHMTKDQLQVVENFSISNEHGTIKFLGTVDLTDVDLNKDVTISAKQVEVYPIDDATKPPIGQKLNRAALVTLEGGVRPKLGMSARQYEQLLQKRIETNGGDHLSYDSDNFTWMFKVPHF